MISLILLLLAIGFIYWAYRIFVSAITQTFDEDILEESSDDTDWGNWSNTD